MAQGEAQAVPNEVPTLLTSGSKGSMKHEPSLGKGTAPCRGAWRSEGLRGRETDANEGWGSFPLKMAICIDTLRAPGPSS